MPEQEMYKGLDFKVVNPLSIDQRINLMDENRDVVICHNIFAIGSGPFFSFFREEGDNSDIIEDLEVYKMFGCVIGYPNTASVSNIPEGFKDSEERFKLQCFAEREFGKQYLSSTKNIEGYVRYVHDFEFDNWYERNIERLVEELNSDVMDVSLVLEGDSSIGVYHAVLLFKRGDGTVLD